MGSLGTTPLVVLLLAVGIAAALCGYTASAVARRNKRRTRGVFLVGLFCGFTAGVVVRHPVELIDDALRAGASG